jgi:hypothetical protein
MKPVAVRRGVRRGQLPPGATGRGRKKRVVAAKEGSDKYDICPWAREAMVSPLAESENYAAMSHVNHVVYKVNEGLQSMYESTYL